MGGGVGKTPLFQRYIQNEFSQQCEPTHMIGHKRKRVKTDKLQFYVQLIETKGMQSEKDYSIISQNIINSDGMFVMDDLTRKSPLESVCFWIFQVRKQQPFSHDFPAFLLATKYQQSPVQQISQDDSYKFFKQCTTEFAVFSAKNNYKFQQIFNLMITRILAVTQESALESAEKAEVMPHLLIKFIMVT